MTPKLNKLLVEINSLKARVVAAQSEFLVSLHSELGFESVDALIEALRASTSKAPKAPKSTPSALKAKKRTRAKITQAVRDEVVSLIGKGATGSSIAAKLGISLPSVQNIKKAAGLVGKKEKKSKPTKRKAAKIAKQVNVAKNAKVTKPKKPAKVVVTPLVSPDSAKV